MTSPGQHAPGSLDAASARTLVAGDLESVFLPAFGMLGISLRHRGSELLRRIDDLASAAARGSSAGIPLLHPWANRLASARYRVAGREIALDPRSPLLHLDEHGLPMHGVPWSKLEWEVVDSARDRLVARLDWDRDELLAVFPFPHRLEIAATLGPGDLTLETTLAAGLAGPVPVSFGFHPYFGIPGLARAEWRLAGPGMRRLVLDGRGIPIGKEEPFAAFDAPLGGRDLDDGFALPGERGSFTLDGAGRRISVDFLEGFRYAQLFAPLGRDFVALEPMTAPANALVSGHGLRLVQPGGSFRATFRIRIEDADRGRR
jgi:aldose 1-epimerase